MKKKETVILFQFGLPDTTLKINNQNVNLKGKNFDIILSIIAVNTINKEPNLNGYVEIPSKIFKTQFSNYKPYIKYLIKQGMIQTDYFSYQKNNRESNNFLNEKNQKSKCYGYRFSWGFSKTVNVIKTIYYQKVTGSTYLNNNKTKSDCQTNQNTPNIYINPDTLRRLKRDFNSAKVESLIPHKTNIENSKYVDMGKWFDNILKLHKWKNVSKSFHFTTNRLYTNFTSLSSITRGNNISLSNKGIIELDIKNSFPLFLSVYCVQQSPDIIHDPDFIHYCELVKNGIFYEELEKILNRSLDCDTNLREEKYQKELKKSKKLFETEGIKTNVIDNRDIPKRKLTRSVVKELFQIYLNGKVNTSPMVKGYGDSFIRDQMKNYFGCVHEQICSIKEKGNVVYHKIVELETRFIFDIIENLYELYPDIRILTCHDSIYFPVNYQHQVKVVWENHMNRLFTSIPGEISNDYEEDYQEFSFEEYFHMEEDNETVITPEMEYLSKRIYGKFHREDLEFDYYEFCDRIDEDDDWI